MYNSINTNKIIKTKIDRLLMAYNLGSRQNQPTCTTNLQITDCQSLLSYASCLDAQAYTKYQLLNLLFPEIAETNTLLNKYSTGIFSTMAKTCIPNDWNSLVDITNKVNNLSTLEYQEYWELINTVEANMDQSRHNFSKYLILAGTVAAFFALQTIRYYDKYKLCKLQTEMTYS